jgi:hypothetical protein
MVGGACESSAAAALAPAIIIAGSRSAVTRQMDETATLPTSFRERYAHAFARQQGRRSLPRNHTGELPRRCATKIGALGL